MIDAKIVVCAGSLLNRNSEGRSMPLSEDRREDADACLSGLRYEQRWEIISAYLEVLEELTAPMGIDSDLPYPKEQIRVAIFQELIENPNSEFRYQLEMAYMQLEVFIPYDDYKTISDFKNASLQAQKMTDEEDPASVMRLVGMMKKVKGDRAVRIQEAISEKMRERLVQIQGVGTHDFVAKCISENPCQVCP